MGITLVIHSLISFWLNIDISELETDFVLPIKDKLLTTKGLAFLIHLRNGKNADPSLWRAEKRFFYLKKDNEVKM